MGVVDFCWIRVGSCRRLLGLLSMVCAGFAEHLPLRVFTTADGLAHDHVSRIRRDSRGFLWICTDEGLSRFDGRQFVNYGRNEGLPHAHVNDLIESRDGTLWIATDGGVSRFKPGPPARGGSLFEVFAPDPGGRPANLVNSLAEDRDGTILCGTNDGLFRMKKGNSGMAFEKLDLNMPPESHGETPVRQINSVTVDRDGGILAGATSGLYLKHRDGPWRRYTTANGLPNDSVNFLLEDAEGRIWVATRGGGVLRTSGAHFAGSVLRGVVYGRKDGLANNDVRAIVESGGGLYWVATTAGLSRISLDAAGTVTGAVSYSEAHGLSDPRLYTLLEDAQASLWIGTNHGGIMRLAREGLTTFGENDGFLAANFHSIVQMRTEEFCSWSGDDSARTLQCFDGQRFRAMPLQIPAALGLGYRGSRLLQDRQEGLWLTTGHGLFRFPPFKQSKGLSSLRPRRLNSHGSPSGYVEGLFEDSRGDVWMTGVGNSALRWERTTGRFSGYSATALLHGQHLGLSVFGEDAAGNVWIGFNQAPELVRYRNGIFETIEVPHSAASTVTAIYLDSRKRLWVAWSTNGLNRIDHPEAEKPGIARITTANGLSSNEIWCLTEDRFGRIYAGTGHGVDRIEPDSQGTGIRVRHYTQADGLARGNIQAAYRTRSGDLWFLTNFGASRLTPRPEIGNPPPSVVLTQLRIEGAEQAVSQFGEQAIRNLRLSPAERYIELEFAGIDAGFDPGLTYEYRLKEMEPAWRPTTQRLVQYGGLSPGVYEFRVRAVNQQGSASPVPASLSFEILAPVWRRWWALVLEVVALGSLLYAAHRRRIRYVLELERVRTRIARDLHDDIGSSLTQIAILSEVARAGSSADGHLSHIARLSRELIDSMSEIVWAINPERDRLSDLTQRMRRFAADLLTERAIELDFRAPAGDLKLDAATRRELFLVFKEAVTNVSSHSGCTGAEVELTVGRHTLTLRVADNGSGTAPDENAGNGLANMRRRAAALGGFLTITPTDPGTTVWLEIPLDGGTRLRKQVGRKSGFRSLLKRRP